MYNFVLFARSFKNGVYEYYPFSLVYALSVLGENHPDILDVKIVKLIHKRVKRTIKREAPFSAKAKRNSQGDLILDSNGEPVFEFSTKIDTIENYPEWQEWLKEGTRHFYEARTEHWPDKMYWDLQRNEIFEGCVISFKTLDALYDIFKTGVEVTLLESAVAPDWVFEDNSEIKNVLIIS